MRSIFFLFMIAIFIACESPEQATGISSPDSLSLDPNRSKVETDTTMHRDSIPGGTAIEP